MSYLTNINKKKSVLQTKSFSPPEDTPLWLGNLTQSTTPWSFGGQFKPTVQPVKPMSSEQVTPSYQFKTPTIKAKATVLAPGGGESTWGVRLSSGAEQFGFPTEDTAIQTLNKLEGKTINYPSDTKGLGQLGFRGTMAEQNTPLGWLQRSPAGFLVSQPQSAGEAALMLGGGVAMQGLPGAVAPAITAISSKVPKLASAISTAASAAGLDISGQTGAVAPDYFSKLIGGVSNLIKSKLTNLKLTQAVENLHALTEAEAIKYKNQVLKLADSIQNPTDDALLMNMYESFTKRAEDAAQELIESDLSLAEREVSKQLLSESPIWKNPVLRTLVIKHGELPESVTIDTAKKLKVNLKNWTIADFKQKGMLNSKGRVPIEDVVDELATDMGFKSTDDFLNTASQNYELFVNKGGTAIGKQSTRVRGKTVEPDFGEADTGIQQGMMGVQEKRITTKGGELQKPTLEQYQKDQMNLAKLKPVTPEVPSGTVPPKQWVPEGWKTPEEIAQFDKGKLPPVKPTETPQGMKESRYFKRVNEAFNGELGDNPLYKTVNMADEAERAIKLVESNPEEARKIALGLKSIKDLAEDTKVSLAYAEKMREKGDFVEYTDVLNTLTMKGTRAGQEIVALRGTVSENNPQHFVKQVIQARTEQIAKKLPKTPGQPTAPASKVTQEIDRQVTQARKIMGYKQFDIQEAQKLLEKLACK